MRRHYGFPGVTSFFGCCKKAQISTTKFTEGEADGECSSSGRSNLKERNQVHWRRRIRKNAKEEENSKAAKDSCARAEEACSKLDFESMSKEGLISAFKGVGKDSNEYRCKPNRLCAMELGSQITERISIPARSSQLQTFFEEKQTHQKAPNFRASFRWEDETWKTEKEAWPWYFHPLDIHQRWDRLFFLRDGLRSLMSENIF